MATGDPAAPNKPNWDVFLAHSSLAKPTVRKLPYIEEADEFQDPPSRYLGL